MIDRQIQKEDMEILMSICIVEVMLKGQLQWQKIFCSCESLLVIENRDANYFFVICLD